VLGPTDTDLLLLLFLRHHNTCSVPGQKCTKTNQRVHQDSKEGVGADLPGSRGSRKSDSW
jgi:hypothetical protein